VVNPAEARSAPEALGKLAGGATTGLETAHDPHPGRGALEMAICGETWRGWLQPRKAVRAAGPSRAFDECRISLRNGRLESPAEPAAQTLGSAEASRATLKRASLSENGAAIRLASRLRQIPQMAKLQRTPLRIRWLHHRLISAVPPAPTTLEVARIV
jgi:hypothetical protein